MTVITRGRILRGKMRQIPQGVEAKTRGDKTVLSENDKHDWMFSGGTRSSSSSDKRQECSRARRKGEGGRKRGGQGHRRGDNKHSTRRGDSRERILHRETASITGGKTSRKGDQKRQINRSGRRRKGGGIEVETRCRKPSLQKLRGSSLSRKDCSLG